MRTLSCMVIATTLALIGCSKEAAGDAPKADAPASADATPAVPGDACGLLSLAEIRRVLPDASRTERNDNLTEHGIKACGWYGKGKAPVLEVSVWQVSGEDDTPMSNASTLAMGVADPTRADAQGAVRLEKIAGVGEDAVAIVEKADEQRGILTTTALLTLRKNGRIATIASGFLDNTDRARALEQLATLGKAAADRL